MDIIHRVRTIYTWTVCVCVYIPLTFYRAEVPRWERVNMSANLIKGAAPARKGVDICATRVMNF